MSVSFWDGGKKVSPPITKAEDPVIASGTPLRGVSPRSFFRNFMVGEKHEGEVLHHVNYEVVMPFPEEIHQKFSGYSRSKHRKMIYQWCKMNSPYYLWLHKQANQLRKNHPEIKESRKDFVKRIKRKTGYKIRVWDKRSKKENLRIIAKWINN